MPSAVDTAPETSCPTLYIRGDEESRESYPAEDFAAGSNSPCDVVVV
jgi:hypothetical protein